VYWTSGLLKEALAVAGLGLVTLGLHRLGTRRIASGAGMALAGVPLLLVSKPYVLFAFVLAGGVWFYWSRAVSRTGGETVEIRPLALLVAAGTATVSIVVLGQLFPTYSIESFADQAAHLQTVGAQLDAGSNYALADPGTRGMAGQLLFAPLALLTALFRPLFFEARNPRWPSVRWRRRCSSCSSPEAPSRKGSPASGETPAGHPH
jgi:hypothetical protein